MSSTPARPIKRRHSFTPTLSPVEQSPPPAEQSPPPLIQLSPPRPAKRVKVGAPNANGAGASSSRGAGTALSPSTFDFWPASLGLPPPVDMLVLAPLLPLDTTSPNAPIQGAEEDTPQASQGSSSTSDSTGDTPDILLRGMLPWVECTKGYFEAVLRQQASGASASSHRHKPARPEQTSAGEERPPHRGLRRASLQLIPTSSARKGEANAADPANLRRSSSTPSLPKAIDMPRERTSHSSRTGRARGSGTDALTAQQVEIWTSLVEGTRQGRFDSKNHFNKLTSHEATIDAVAAKVKKSSFEIGVIVIPIPKALVTSNSRFAEGPVRFRLLDPTVLDMSKSTLNVDTLCMVITDPKDGALLGAYGKAALESNTYKKRWDNMVTWCALISGRDGTL
ncbi:hypothetical protein A1Q2_02327 [Trichosporon asahii var. asahii CBS 8904]|uniref:Uncharacterized protein n=1 Tax=Trichosporon asahii var. asahii (strain CBS 8904) TaxID=1220162 RepID=K1VV18_TRIAC|nr:hypothetical protein A1Q2_02327 [Trichosporon asahii var. asahii CBS 8904]